MPTKRIVRTPAKALSWQIVMMLKPFLTDHVPAHNTIEFYCTMIEPICQSVLSEYE